MEDNFKNILVTGGAGYLGCQVISDLVKKYPYSNITVVDNFSRGRVEAIGEVVEENLGKKAVKNMMPMQPGDVKETYADISKAKSYLGYEPKTKIEEGVKIFCDWFKENQDWLLELEDGKQ